MERDALAELSREQLTDGAACVVLSYSPVVRVSHERTRARN